jgi:hypothetical protein
MRKAQTNLLEKTASLAVVQMLRPQNKIETRNENIVVYLGCFEEFIQDLRQCWVCMNSKLDVLYDRNIYTNSLS